MLNGARVLLGRQGWHQNALRIAQDLRSGSGAVKVGGLMVTIGGLMSTSMNGANSVRALSTSAGLLDLKEPVKLYQYDVCPFCNKAQTFMEYHSVPYEKVEVNPLTKAEIKFSEYKMVPFAMINGTQVNGSGEIIKTLLGDDKAISDREMKWFQWVDDHLVHVLPVNIYRTPKEAIQSFDYITTNSNFSMAQKLSVQYAGAFIMYFVAKRAKKKYNLGDDPRKELYDAVSHWAQNGLHDQQFHGGSTHPDTADLAVFGVLRSIEGNYDTWNDLLKTEFEGKEAFWKWYFAVKDQVETNKCK